MIKKELYAAPETEVLELRLEGMIAASEDTLSNFNEEVYDGSWK